MEGENVDDHLGSDVGGEDSESAGKKKSKRGKREPGGKRQAIKRAMDAERG